MNKQNEKDWLSRHNEGTSILFNLQNELEHLARAFGTTGNVAMSRQLHDVAKDIMTAHDIVRDAVGQNINEGWRKSEAQTAFVLKHVLAAHMGDHEEV